MVQRLEVDFLSMTVTSFPEDSTPPPQTPIIVFVMKRTYPLKIVERFGQQ